MSNATASASAYTDAIAVTYAAIEGNANTIDSRLMYAHANANVNAQRRRVTPPLTPPLPLPPPVARGLHAAKA